MGEYDALANKAEQAGNEIFWYGSANDEQIESLQRSLSCPLPGSYKRFLRHYGGGGVVGDDVSGIEDNDASKTSGGTALGGTLTCRGRFELPHHLVVIYFHDDEICWCLDTSRIINDECPVVSYSLALQKVDRVIASSFSEFFKQYLEMYSDGA